MNILSLLGLDSKLSGKRTSAPGLLSRSLQGVGASMMGISSLAILMPGCGTDGPYEAPAGTEVVLSPEEFTASEGAVVKFRAAVVDSETGYYYNDIHMWVQSSYPGVILVPQSAIQAKSDDDTDWQVSGESYYELTQVDTTIEPNYLDTATDSQGGADVFTYFRCLPVKCDDGYFDTCTLQNSADATTCELQAFSLTFSTAMSSATIKFTAE